MHDFDINLVVDASGSFCPGPIMALIETIRYADMGSVIEFVFDDNDAVSDAALWINKAGHQHLRTVKKDNCWRLVVKKTKQHSAGLSVCDIHD